MEIHLSALPLTNQRPWASCKLLIMQPFWNQGQTLTQWQYDERL